MTQLIRLTESDLHKIVEETVRRTVDEGWGKDALKTAGIGAAFGLGAAGTLATDNPISRGLDRQFADQEEVGRAFPEDRAEFGKALSPRGNAEDNTISWEKANQFEGKIRMAVMESINKIISEMVKENHKDYNEVVRNVDRPKLNGKLKKAWEKEKRTNPNADYDSFEYRFSSNHMPKGGVK